MGLAGSVLTYEYVDTLGERYLQFIESSELVEANLRDHFSLSFYRKQK